MAKTEIWRIKCEFLLRSLTWLKVGGGGGPGGGGGGGGMGILSHCWHLCMGGGGASLHCLNSDDTHWLLQAKEHNNMLLGGLVGY